MLRDSRDFEKRVAGAESDLQRLFDADSVVVLSRAPGRLDVMGGVADYSGSIVAETTIGEAVHAGLQLRPDDLIRIWSRTIEGSDAVVEMPIPLLFDASAVVRGRLNADGGRKWAAYSLGCFTMLANEHILPSDSRGANIVIESSVPLGAGLSSSAALEIATMYAIRKAYGLTIDDTRIALLAEKVENDIAGAPCGIMDQMASCLGKPEHLVRIDCSASAVNGYLKLPDGVKVYGIMSGVRHSVAGSPYVRARAASFMGKKLIEGHRRDNGAAPISCLCELTPVQYRRDHAALLPARISGEDFIHAEQDHCDPATQVTPDQSYPVRAAVAHAVYENARVQLFLACLEEASRTGSAQRSMALIRAGEAMYASHWSYTRIGLGSRETTSIARMAREAGPSRGIFGAKITGGGSGGTVAVLTYGEDGEHSVREIANRYEELTGNSSSVVEGGRSPGAAEFGTRTVVLP